MRTKVAAWSPYLPKKRASTIASKEGEKLMKAPQTTVCQRGRRHPLYR
jgi:hypothetical protein